MVPVDCSHMKAISKHCLPAVACVPVRGGSHDNPRDSGGSSEIIIPFKLWSGQNVIVLENAPSLHNPKSVT